MNFWSLSAKNSTKHDLRSSLLLKFLPFKKFCAYDLHGTRLWLSLVQWLILSLLSKLKINLLQSLYFVLKSYLSNHFFQVCYSTEFSNYPVELCVLQGSILNPALYFFFIVNIPTCLIPPCQYLLMILPSYPPTQSLKWYHP